MRLLLLLACLSWSWPVAAAELLHVAPQGDRGAVMRVAVNFDAPVKRLGQLTGPAPVTLSCTGLEPKLAEIKPAGRWADTQTYVFDFGRTLPAGLRCEIKPVAGFQDAAGQVVKMLPVYRFDTGGPVALAINATRASQAIAEDEIFIAHTRGPADGASVERHAWCSATGVGERMAVKLLSAPERQALLQANAHGGPSEHRVLFRCARKLPPGAAVSVVWGAGIAGPTGLLTQAPYEGKFQVRQEFTVKLHCERENANADCSPLAAMQLRFTASVRREDVLAVRLVGPGGKTWAAALASDEEASDFVDHVQFNGPFPPDAAFTLRLPPKIRDDEDRPLANRERLAQLQLKTAGYPPLIKFAADFGIVERHAGGLLPVTVRNLDPRPAAGDATPQTIDGSVPGTAAKLRVLRITQDEDLFTWWQQIQGHYSRGNEGSVLGSAERAKTWLLPKPHGPKPMEVVGIPLGEPGYYVVEAESQSLANSQSSRGGPMFVHATALNTNLSVHFKRGGENQLVWVTTLDKGEPVAEARISVRNCHGQQVAFGKTGADGTMAVRRRLPDATKCPSHTPWGYVVTARASRDGVEDFSFVKQEWQQGIEPWRFALPHAGNVPDMATHTVFDRSLFRAGETVHMKHFARRRTTGGFAFAPGADLPEKLAIQLTGTDIRYELPLAWKGGVAESRWVIPGEAKLGRYWVSFVRAGEKASRVYEGEPESDSAREAASEEGNYGTPNGYWRGGSFRVGEFRLPVLKGEVAGSATPVVGAKSVSVDLKLAFIAGGAAGGERVRVRSQAQPLALKAPEGYERYALAAGPAGRDEAQGGKASAQAESAPLTEGVFDDQRDVQLDKAGTRRVSVAPVPAWQVPASIVTEMEFSDASGEIHTAAGHTRWFPSAVVPGLRAEGTPTAGQRARVTVATLGTDLQPQPGVRYSVKAWNLRTLVHRKRLLGGYYSYDTREETDALGEVCQGQSDARGAGVCEVSLPAVGKQVQSGQLLLEMKALDAQGRASYTQTSLWFGADAEAEAWYDQSDSDRIDVIPEKRHYEAGDTAVLQVRMPFRQATALVSVEREGVIERFVTTLSGSQPSVRLPIKASYGPNAFVSVLVVRGRVGDVQPTALVDLGKPAYKLGIAEITVGRKGYELVVKVEPAQAVYRTRDEAVVKVRVTRPDGSPAKGGEFALAAVDEALLELARNDSWQLLSRLMARRGYAVQTSTAQTQVIGKRHFGLKAMPAGGGGGRQSTRELFDTLIKWEGKVVLDEQGEATVKLPLNDSLTRIRIVAVAHQGANLYGTGFASIRTTQEIQLFSGLPPVVRDADQLHASFTVRNLSPRSERVTVSAAASALVQGARVPLPALAAQTVVLPAGESRLVSWPLSVPLQASRIEWRAEARAEGSGAADALKLTQTVLPAVPTHIVSATLTQLTAPINLPVARPAGALPGRGSLDVSLKARLGASTDGVKDWMGAYPYLCLEQKVSKIIATGDVRRWDDIRSRMSAYLDDQGLAAYFPNPAPGRGSPVLTAYLLSAAHEAGYTVPDATQARMLEGLAAFVEGRVKLDPRQHWAPRDDLAMRKLQAIEALARFGRATPQHIGAVPITPGLWPLSSVIDWLSILTRMPQLPHRDKQLAEAEAHLRARMVKSGTLTQFTNERDDYWWWLMVSPDGNAARAISTLMDLPSWQADIPRLVRGVMARQHEGHWNTTPANVWGVNMLNKFMRQYESDPVSGATRIALSGSSTGPQALDWQHLASEEAQRPAAVAAGQRAAPPTGSAWRDPGKTLRWAWPASGAGQLSVLHEGSGKPWLTVQTRAARVLAAPVNAGFALSKKLVPIEQKVPGRWSRGDVVQVQIEVHNPAPWTWVVVNDPIPAGATLLGSGLGRESQITAPQDSAAGGGYWGTPAFIERAFDGYRAYYEWVPKGSMQLSYSMRLNSAGEFKLPPTRVEAMYAPENFGEAPNADWKVE